jgi:nitroreductase
MMAQMTLLDVMLARTTPKELVAPAPDSKALNMALEAAVAAPDHGRLRPWRFILIENSMRQNFGAILAQALKRRKPEATEAELEREAAKPLRAPLVIAVGAKIVSRPGVPEVEQILAVGAAIQNLSLALYAQGYAASWKTGEPAYDVGVKAALGLGDSDAIVGFIYVGTPASAASPRPRSPASEFLQHWNGAMT